MADEALSAGAVARRLGVAVTTLRTWHQRYGLGPSRHVPGHHRRYTAEDLSRLEVMRRLTAEGIAPAEAARWARYAPDVPPSESAPAPTPARSGGGFAIPVGRAGPTARGLARAAIRLDVGAMHEIMARAVTELGVVSTWDLVLRPVLAGIGERHMATKRLIEVEHLFSRTATEVFAAVPRPRGGQPPRILLACTDEEQHSLPLEALAAALAADGISCRLLGARVPPGALSDTVERTGPDVVMLWSHVPETAHLAQLVALQEAPRRPVLILAGGPGWLGDSLPTGVVAPTSLGEALRLTQSWSGTAI
ncbi:transcriptional regulator [Asanoa ishikariensis]|uniref:B12 binding domain-containing protein n=1 Tax=Asanoa ishikariensis TaxID=137265 RepID=A0A1H3KXQ7_9ACTN|nr:MerR family transcriptional regulator [Asanoa ishikariensis]GIF69648.1 transcriptional regulator [Asanoa ishikariensis]SDY56508.1 B12 binding domain-containing protein [Asanoa ishikariensis]